MTFEDWLTGKNLGSMELEFARDAWKAATKAEREACAKAVEATKKRTYSDCSGSLDMAARAIRKRSNAELRGGPLAARPA